ncbi:TetR family transcriptional regulator (plasmid) [Pantoea agglomerans]|nr:TetR family transcriptional regulator [Pantoea agglomerans]
MTVEKTPRKRLSREARRRQLSDVAWQIMQTEGSEALTLARVGDAAGVSKPVVYDHFTTRHGLLAALYDDFDRRQTEKMEAAMNAAPMVMQQKAEVLAACYVDCVMTEGREIPELLSALSTSPELAAVKRHYQLDFIARCQRWFVPLAGSSGIPEAGMWGLLGARMPSQVRWHAAMSANGKENRRSLPWSWRWWQAAVRRNRISIKKAARRPPNPSTTTGVV